MTFRENTPPTFNESVTDVVMNCRYFYYLTLPVGVDAEGDMINYQLTYLSSYDNPPGLEYDFSVSTLVRLNFTGWTPKIYEYNYKIYGNESGGGYSSEANFTVSLNNIPMVTFKFNSLESQSI